MLGDFAMAAASKRLCHSWKFFTPDLPEGQRKFFKNFDPAAGARGTPLPGGVSGLCGSPPPLTPRFGAAAWRRTRCGRWTQGPPRRPAFHSSFKLKSHPSLLTRSTAPPGAEPAAHTAQVPIPSPPSRSIAPPGAEPAAHTAQVSPLLCSKVHRAA